MVIAIALTLIAGTPADTLQDELDRDVRAVIGSKSYVGLQVAICRGGDLVFQRVYGTVAPGSKAHLPSTQPLKIGSVTKPMIATLAWKLIEEGRLKPTDTIERWYPKVKNSTQISIGMLLSHTSGLRDYYPLDFVDSRFFKSISVDRLIQEYGSGEPDFAPGTGWSYSNTGYTILGRILERVSGRKIGDLLEELFRPIGLKDTFYFDQKGSRTVPAGYRAYDLRSYSKAPSEAIGWVNTAGGIASTAGELAKWGDALASGKFLRPATLAEMITPPEIAGKQPNYAYGFQVTPFQGHRAWRHGGVVSGFSAQILIVPDEHLCVAAVGNTEVFSPDKLVQVLAARLLRGRRGNASGDLSSTYIERPIRVRGVSPESALQQWLDQIRNSTLDRAALGKEFGAFLNETRVREAQDLLERVGTLERIVPLGTGVRGGMEVTRHRLKGGRGSVDALLYRQPDGRIMEVLFVQP